MARVATRPARSQTPKGEAPLRDQKRAIRFVGVAIVAFLIFFPTKQLVEQRMRMERLEQRLTALRVENRELQDEVGRLRDPEELELKARERLGLVRPGERVYVMVPQPTPEPAVSEADPEPSRLSRLWEGLLRLIRGGG